MQRFLIFIGLSILSVGGSGLLLGQDLPRVFLIGENQEGYEKMLGNYEDLLLNVAGKSMDKAYDHWLDMLLSLEDYASSISYDINGVKIWLNVFWQKDGKIDYIVYYPKPNSRNIDFDEFTRFLSGFVEQYQMGLNGKKNFSHYGSASFPTLGKRSSDKG